MHRSESAGKSLEPRVQLPAQTHTEISDRVLRLAGAAVLLLGSIYSVLSFLDGRVLSGIAAACLITLVVIDAASMKWRRKSLFGREPLLYAAGLFIAHVAWLDWQAGFYWAFPAVILATLVLERPRAIRFNGLLLAAIVGIAFANSSWIEVFPIGAGLLLAALAAGTYINQVDRQRALLQAQVLTDPLTGAYNRRYFGIRAEKLIESKRRYGHPSSLIIFDIDHFKSINDRWGHDVGDRVLRILIDTVKARIRVMDEIFRYGGEEFVILLSDTRIDQAAKLAQDITDMVAEVRIIEGGPLTISSGVGELIEGETPENWIKRCDLALYEAKRSGRRRISLAGEDISGADARGIHSVDSPTSNLAG
jgi:diguanylate cyclase (GGDEF)-like protein